MITRATNAFAEVKKEYKEETNYRYTSLERHYIGIGFEIST